MVDTPPEEKLPERKPWSMAWVAIAIGTYIIFYTAINVFFRKPVDTAHEPAAEAAARQRDFVQASMNGWTRYAVRLNPRADDTTIEELTAVTRSPTPSDLARAVPLDLTLIFPGKPSMHLAPARITAPAVLPADGVWRCLISIDDPQNTAPFGEALAYAKDNHLRLFLQDEERAPFDGTLVTALPVLEVALPAHVLPAGDWNATLYTKDEIFTWSFVVPATAAPVPPGP